MSRFFLTFIFLAIFLSCNESSMISTFSQKQYSAWAVGNQDSLGYASVLFSDDNAQTWKRKGERSIALKGIDANNLFVVDKDNIWVVCNDNTILKTEDGGDSWKRIETIPNGVVTGFYDISIVDKTTIWVSGENGVVYNSTDNGENWIVHDANIFHNGLVQGIRAINSKLIYAVGQDKDRKGFILRSLDGGTIWQSIDVSNDSMWIRVVASDENNIVIYGILGNYVYTQDAGLTWNSRVLKAGGGGGNADINDMVMLDAKTWWAALDLDNIRFTDNNGSSWQEQQPVGDRNVYLVGISTYDRENALIVGMSVGWPQLGKIMHTTDGGANWKLVKETDYYLNKVSYLSKEK